MLDVDALEARLRQAPSHGEFDPAMVAGLPEPARRYLLHALAPGAPLSGWVELRMHGTIRVGTWLPFRARQVHAPPAGMVWRAEAGLLIGPLAVGFRGFDAHDAEGDAGQMAWRLLWAVPVLTTDGPDVARSGRGRLAAEACFLPQVLLPQRGVEWRAENGDHAVATLQVGPDPFDLHVEIDAEGRLREAWLYRWGDPEGGPHRFVPFGVECTAERTFGGVTIPSAGRAGWFFGSDRFAEGEFFRFAVDDARVG